MLFLLVLLISVILHEVAHGWVADKFGDPTARLSGRLTLNPIPHIDPVGSILVPLFLIFTGSPVIFGWAKPVPIDPFNLKDPRRDSGIIALAGPGTNFSIALVSSILLRLLLLFEHSVFLTMGSTFLAALIQINLILGVLNFIPIAPLDGFKIVGGFLSEKRAQEWYQLERYGVIFLLLALFFPIGGSNLFSLALGPLIHFLGNLLIPAQVAGRMI